MLTNQEKEERFRERAQQYLIKKQYDESVTIIGKLGDGTDGFVFQTSILTAIKVFGYENGYINERDTYERLAEYGLVEKIDHFWVPRMIDCDDELMIVEMDKIDHRPFILDFAKVKLNNDPDFSDNTTELRNKKIEDLFEHHALEVRRLIETLESYLIFYIDPQPGNIQFDDLPKREPPNP